MEPNFPSKYFAPWVTSKDILVVLLKITLIMFVVEGMIMLVLGEVHSPFHSGTLALLDAVSLIVLSTPIIYFWVIRPFILERKQSEQRFRQLAENIDDVFWMRSADFNQVIYVSPKFEWFWGRSCKSVYDRPDVWFEAIHPEDRERVNAEIGKVGGKNFEVEYRIVHPDGKIYWIRDRGFSVLNESGEIFRIAGIAEDITERKRTESVLENEARLNSAFEAIDEGVWDWNVVTGEVYFTPRWPEILGYTLDEIEPRIETWESRLHPDDKPGVIEATKNRLKGNTPHYISEYRIKNKAGEWIWILGRGKVIEWDANGKPARIVSADHDITERKNVFKKQRELENQLSHISRLSAMGELTTVLAHELNQPLAVIASGSQLLRDNLRSGTSDPKTMMDTAELLAEQSERARDLVHRIRAFVSKENSSRDSIPVNKLVDDMTSLIQLDAQRSDVIVQLELGEDLPEVLAKPLHIQQVILNLVHNSVEAMSENGSHPGRITIRTDVSTDDTIKISVRDTGKGIPAEIRDKIFDPFFTTKPAGMGMGLSICRTIIEAHKGTLTVDSDDGSGTVFTLTLPAFKGAHDDGR